MFETFGFETLTAPEAAIWFGAALGLVFGVLAQITRFCLRRAVAGDASDQAPAGAVWLTALAAALVGTQGAVLMGWIDFDAHRFMATDLRVLAIVLGGALFGAGMVLTRGCLSRLTVLGASGNLRALAVLGLAAITAQATIKGVLAPVRTALSEVAVPLSSPALPGHPALWALVVALAAGLLVARARVRLVQVGMAIALGLLVPLGWVGTGLVLLDDFDPIALQSLSFTQPLADSLFWTVTSTAVPANFGIGLIGGVFVGAALSALARGEFAWVSFATPGQTGRYAAGAVLMGFGGVLAGGCTIGAGLAGVPTLSLAAILALTSIVLGAVAVRFAPGLRSGTVAVPAE